MKNTKLFGQYVGQAAQAAGKLILQKDVAMFLARPNAELGGVSPVEIIWAEGKKGLKKVKDLLMRIMTGSFP